MIKDSLPPICRRCGIDMTAPANHVHGLLVRKQFIDCFSLILSGIGHNNVIITGRAGVGKTAAVQALAKAVWEGKYPVLKGRIIANISIDMLLHDCYTTADKGVRIQGLFEEAAENKIILFIDEIHRLCGYGADSLGNIAKPFLCRDDIQVIGATTTDEYQRYICPEEALTRRFEDVEIFEPSKDEVVDILRVVYENRHAGINGDNKMFALISECAKQYLPERGDPDRSISLMDNTLAWMANNNCPQPIRPEYIYNALAVRTGVNSDNIQGRISGGRISGIADSLAKQFHGWNNEAKCAANILHEALTRSVRDKGPLCSIILSGPDTALLDAFAYAAAREMGFAGRTVYVNLDVEKMPPRKGAADSYKALILNMGSQMQGIESVLNIMRTDCSGMPLLLLLPCDMPERSAVGFGAQSYAPVKENDSLKQLSTLLYGNGMPHHVLFGSPSFEGPEDVIAAFNIILKDGLARIYGDKAPVITPGIDTQKKLLEAAEKPNAWSAMHTAAEQIIQDYMLVQERRILPKEGIDIDI